MLTLSTKCACPDGCVQAPPSPGTTKSPGHHVEIEVDGISIGTIICIS